MARRDDLINSGTSGWLYARSARSTSPILDGGPVPARLPAEPRPAASTDLFSGAGRGIGRVNSYSLIGLPATFSTWYNPRAGTFNPRFVGSGPTPRSTCRRRAPTGRSTSRPGITPPQVSAPAPNPQSVRVGTTASFSVTVMGPARSPTAGRQAGQRCLHSLFDRALRGTASSTLTITNAQNDDTGFYRCLVSNAGGGGTPVQARSP